MEQTLHRAEALQEIYLRPGYHSSIGLRGHPHRDVFSGPPVRSNRPGLRRVSDIVAHPPLHAGGSGGTAGRGMDGGQGARQDTHHPWFGILHSEHVLPGPVELSDQLPGDSRYGNIKGGRRRAALRPPYQGQPQRTAPEPGGYGLQAMVNSFNDIFLLVAIMVAIVIIPAIFIK